MSVLYAIAGGWSLVAAVVLIGALFILPPRNVVDWGDNFRVAFGWPWYLGCVVATLIWGFDIEADQ